MITWSDASWRHSQHLHEQRIDSWTTPHLDRRRRGITHPVQDFLFDYYTLSPAKLRAWHPGLGVMLTGDVSQWQHVRGYTVTDAGAFVDLESFKTSAIRQSLPLLMSTRDNEPAFGCFGRHEWAMVYRQNQDSVRHSSRSLRVSPTEIDAVVESSPLRCTHFDAFRFYTKQARPLNVLTPTRANQPDLEQPGCLHAAMDLYKWSYRAYPVVGADLVADAFELAQHVRAIDMRASPYDLEDLGYPPIRIESPEGRAEYVGYQRDIATQASELRNRLITQFEQSLDTCAW